MSHRYVYAPSPSDLPGQTIMDRTVPQGQNLMSPLITHSDSSARSGQKFVAQNPLTGGIRAMLQNPLRPFFPFTWFACFSSILPSVHAGPPRFSRERLLTWAAAPWARENA